MNRYGQTEREALQTTIDLWTWLTEHPLATKADWPSWLALDYLDKEPAIGEAAQCEMLADCPCCQFVAETDECEAALIGDDEPPWRDSDGDDTDDPCGAVDAGCIIDWPGGFCNSLGSPYHSWVNAKRVQAALRATNAARAVATLAKETLAKLDKKGTHDSEKNGSSTDAS